MPPAANARALDPGWDYRPESHELAPDGRWNQPAEQKGILPEQKESDWKRLSIGSEPNEVSVNMPTA
ncbi:MAG: hypothetical protein LBQ54_16215 [Planctomycetaceae bacterium]|nr:hypothetical protein [Planctomycetaceae bacterium]